MANATPHPIDSPLTERRCPAPARAGACLGAGGPRRQRGFTLVEVSVALWVLTVALLAGMALVLQQPRVVKRIDAERQAVQVMEWTLEEMRAGLIPLQSTPDVGWSVGSFVAGSPAPDLKVAVAVAPAGPPGLFRVVLLARYTVYGYLHQRRLQTMIFRPGAGPS